MLKTVFKACVGIAAKDYWNGWLYACEIGAVQYPVYDPVHCQPIASLDQVRESPYEDVRGESVPLDGATWGFGAWISGHLAAVCWFRAGEPYRLAGGWLNLASDEAELVQITTAQSARGQGIATHLIRYSVCQMRANGFRKLYAKVWRDNMPSRKAFDKAGWSVERRFFSVRLRGRSRPVNLTLPST